VLTLLDKPGTFLLWYDKRILGILTKPNQRGRLHILQYDSATKSRRAPELLSHEGRGLRHEVSIDIR